MATAFHAFHACEEITIIGGRMDDHASHRESGKKGKMMDHPLITAALAAPKTHCVVTTYADGTVKRLETRSFASAETRAVGERRKIGRDLISRETGETVRVVSVEVVAL